MLLYGSRMKERICVIRRGLNRFEVQCVYENKIWWCHVIGHRVTINRTIANSPRNRSWTLNREEFVCFNFNTSLHSLPLHSYLAGVASTHEGWESEWKRVWSHSFCLVPLRRTRNQRSDYLDYYDHHHHHHHWAVCVGQSPHSVLLSFLFALRTDHQTHSYTRPNETQHQAIATATGVHSLFLPLCSVKVTVNIDISLSPELDSVPNRSLAQTRLTLTLIWE